MIDEQTAKDLTKSPSDTWVAMCHLGHLEISLYVKVLILLYYWQGCQGGQLSHPP
jgi:hypothetical protein